MDRDHSRFIRCWTHVMGWVIFGGVWLPGAGLQADPTPRYLGPAALEISGDTQTLFVACAEANRVLFVDTRSGNVGRQVELPGAPSGLALTTDGKRLMVTCAAAESLVVVLAVESGATLATMRAGHTAMAPVLSSDDRWLYVCNRFDHDISVFDVKTGQEIVRCPAIREPVAATLTPDNRWLLVANHLPLMSAGGQPIESVAAEITIIDTQTHEPTAVELHSGATGLRDICVSADGRYAFATHLLSNFENVPFRLDMGWVNVNVISVIDIQQQRLTRTIGLDELDLGASNPWGIACSNDGTQVAVTVSGTHELSVIGCDDLLGDVARRTMSPIPGAWPVYPSLGESLWRRIALPGKGPRSLVLSGSTAYVAQYFSDSIAVVQPQPGGGDQIDVIRLGRPVEWTRQRTGEWLFNDATICYQQWQSCGSCHPDGRTDGLNWDLMNDGVGNPKNTKSMLLAHQTPPAMAMGVRESAEVAVRSGLTHILFSRRPEAESIAIDTYLKLLQPVPSPYLTDGELSAAAERGRSLFHSPEVACHRCHEPPLFTDLKRHPMRTAVAEESPSYMDTPTLIEVWRTAPYRHDGRYVTVRELLMEGRHGLSARQIDQLSDQQVNDLVEYVLSL